MSRLHLVRVGALGAVGRFAAADAGLFSRDTRVVTRTERGLELGTVLAPPDDHVDPALQDGTILRAMTIEDRLLESRLAKNSHAAYAACQQRLQEMGLSACLMDVEHLFDGHTLYFYFLGEIDPAVAQITDELAEIYETGVQFRSFAETVNNGCGPGCGTESATGHGCASCATGCAVASACSTRKH